MLAKERQNIIIELIKKESAVTTAELIEKFNISDETVRRDLVVLENEGKLQRVHGGAVALAGMKTFLSLEHRTKSAKPEKAVLSALAAKKVNEGEIIGIDSGSTAVEFAKALAQNFSHLTIVTHSLDVFELLAKFKNFNVILCGGHFHKKENAFCGSLTLETYKSLHVQKAFVCPTAISLSNGIGDFDHMLTEVQKQLVCSANEVFVLADSNKFESYALLKISEMSPNFTYITDPGLPDKLKKLYADNNIKVISCEGDLK